jgi:hypothetical protein
MGFVLPHFINSALFCTYVYTLRTNLCPSDARYGLICASVYAAQLHLHSARESSSCQDMHFVNQSCLCYSHHVIQVVIQVVTFLPCLWL